MSTKKISSWRNDRTCLHVRLYLQPAVVEFIHLKAKNELREESYILSKAIEAYFDKTERGLNPLWTKKAG